MSILKLKPSCKDYLWGGSRLKTEYGKEYDKDVLAESWELSCHPDGPSVIVNGAYAGQTLHRYIDENGKEVLGRNCRRFRDFPILIKFIDAKENLSIQVHPDNRYALKNEKQYGKTEMWYVMDAAEDAFLYYGFENEISKEEFEQRIRDDTLLEVLNAVPVQKGDVLFIESGTIHAIGKNILIAEIQQNSNVTYRVYDYGRVGKDGKKRDLHIEKALAVTKRVPIVRDKSSYPHVADCDYFTVDKLNLDGKVMKKMEGVVSDDSFASILILDGAGTICCREEILQFKKGDSFFLSAGSGSYVVEGSCDALITTIREKAAPVRIGIRIGSIETRIGLVDIHHKIIASEVMRTNSESRDAGEFLREICERTLELLEKEKITLDQCVGVGIGIPGTIDRKKGIVRYSNNMKWENVNVAKEVSEFLPIPIRVANDADCAALGETVAGAGKGFRDVIMLTLGAGVGSGIILNGEIYEGTGIGGTELGHMVIAENGAPCTCGRHGCLEAYASVPALKRNIKLASGKELLLQEIFDGAAGGEGALKEVVDQYTQRLGTGIINAVNIFRPQLVLLGGELTEQASALIEPLSEIVKNGCFGREQGELPELEVAVLGQNAGVVGAANLI